MAYLVHHTLNQNGTFSGGKRNPLPFDENIIADELQHKKNSETDQYFFPFKSNGRKSDLECTIHGIINSCEIEGAYLGRLLSIFDQKLLFLKKHFRTFER